jgi:hypothetical protein
MSSDTNSFFTTSNGIRGDDFCTSASLNLENQPVGAYYFNSDNSLAYTKNSFNYRKYHQYDSNSVIQEVLSVGTYPRLSADELDTTKQYSLPSTSINVAWMALAERYAPTLIIDVNNIPSAYYMGLDANENVYVALDYYFTELYIYNEDNTLAHTFPSQDLKRDIGIVKYSSSGVVQWCARISSGGSGTRALPGGFPGGFPGDDDLPIDSNKDATLNLRYLTTDPSGNSYLFGEGYDLTEFRDASDTVIQTLAFSGPHAFLVQYNTLGTPTWISLIGIAQRTQGTVLYYENSDPSNLYVFGTQPSAMQFYTGSLVAPILVETLPYDTSGADRSSFLLKYRASSGVFQWATRMRGSALNNWGMRSTRHRELISTDTQGNVFLVGMYNQFTDIYNAPGSSSDVSSIPLPPPADQALYIPVDTDRAWTGIMVDGSGQNMIACVANELVYVSTNAGISWEPAYSAGERNWSTVYCSGNFGLLVAAEYGGFIYYSIDRGSSWTVASGFGVTARNWTRLVGNRDSFGNFTQELIALTQNDLIYYTSNGITWNAASGAPLADWAAAAYANDSGGAFQNTIAFIRNGQAYISGNKGANWSLVASSPSANWSGACGGALGVGFDKDFYGFYASVKNGPIYRVNLFGTLWTVVGPTANWSDLQCNDYAFELILGATYDGPVYQSSGYSETLWLSTSIPRLWTQVSVNRDGKVSALIVQDGQIYVRYRDFTSPDSDSSTSTVSSFLLKYSPEGVAQWITYMDCGGPLGNGDNWNVTTTITSTPEGNLILAGKTSGDLLAYARQDFDNPVKKLTLVPDTSFNTFLVCYSGEGTPLWVTRVASYNDWFEQPSAIAVDPEGRIYLANCTRTDTLFYNSNDIRSCPYAFRLVNNRMTTYLAKYYNDGTLESIAAVGSGSFSEVLSYALQVHPVSKNIYLTGADSSVAGLFLNFDPFYVYNSPATMTNPSDPFPSPNLTKFRVEFNIKPLFVAKFTQSSASSFLVQAPGYNTVFQPRFSIGGGARRLIGIYPKDYPIELWGGPTGFTPGVLQLDDLNTAVVCYPGHDPGYTRELLYGIPETSAQNTRWLAVQVDEPTFPANDPQPVTPGTIPYGFLLFYAQFPAYTTSVVFNNSRNDRTDLTLTALGPIANDQSITGIYVGDVVRILGISGGNNQYITLKVKALTAASIIFEQLTSTACFYWSSTETFRAQLLVNNETCLVPMYYQPSVIRQGTLKVVVSASSKEFVAPGYPVN